MPRQLGNSVRGRTGFAKTWGLRASVSFPPFPSPSHTFLRSPQVSHVQKAENASYLRKSLRKRWLRRLYVRPPVRTDSAGGGGESQDNPTGVENAIFSWREIARCFWVTGVFLGGKSHDHRRL